MRLSTYFRTNETAIMQIGVMNHPARDPIGEIEWIGQNGFDFVDFTLEPPPD